MRYVSFTIQHYRAIESPIKINLTTQSLIPLIGVNECGKTTILQAIFAFDYLNDTDYEGRHLENTINLYHTTDKDPVITAEIEIAYNRLKIYWDAVCNATEQPKVQTPPTSPTPPSPPPTPPPQFPLSQNKYAGLIRISRNLKTKQYSIAEWSSLPVGLQHALGREIVLGLPYILYNDDFQDRPPSTVEIENPKPARLSGWLGIYERLFNATNSSYSIFTTAELDDTRRQNSILSDVQNTLNNTLTKTWKTFLLDRLRSIQVRLKITKAELQIEIVENIGHVERFFKVVDRSKGFLWFYNFVMKLEFNPKLSGGRKDTIYLLDEPGSYLHPAAQEKLCAKLKEISNKYGKVIFCTHSHHLLDPEQIPINSILIVRKSANKTITVTPLPQYSTSGERLTALQPVFEALQISASEFKQDDLPVLAVEGIYDKYAIKMFLPEADKLRILPGTSADSILKNIQYLNAFGRHYIAIWDNDPEGRKTKNRAQSMFGPYEARRFDLLPSREENQDRAMEQMFDAVDLDTIRIALDLPSNANYESIMAGLFYAPRRRRDTLIAKVGASTRHHFEILQAIVNKRLQSSRELLENE